MIVQCAGGCSRRVDHRHFACPRCWWRLPAVYAHMINQSGAGLESALGNARDWYRKNPTRDPDPTGYDVGARR